MDSGTVTITPVDSDPNIRAITKFRESLQTAMGPNGSLKMMVTGGGYLQLTCLNTILLKYMDLENPICRYISQVSSGLYQHGLYFSVFVSHLVEQQWSHDRISKHKLSQIVCLLKQTFQNVLTSQLVYRKVDFSTVNSLLPLVKTTICSKGFNIWPGFDVDKFCIEIIKVFINCIDDQANSVGRVYIKVKSGLNKFSAHNGLMYEIFEKHDLNNIKQIKGKIRILIFTITLDEHKGDSVIGTSKVIAILEQAIKLKLKMVAFQKVVSCEIKLYLKRRNIILLDRMGTDFTSMLLYLSDAVPISEVSINVASVKKMMGTLSSITYIYFNDSDYILLNSDNVSLGTLLIQHSGLAGVDHIKSLVEQAITSLRSLALHPMLIPGGGCLEVWLIAHLNLLKASRTDKEFSIISGWIERAFLSTCSSFPPTMMDSVYHHGWDEKHSRCRCGFVSKTMIEQNEGSFILLSEVVNCKAGLKLNEPKQLSTAIHQDVLVDTYEQKMNVIESALETFAGLSEIGFVVYKH